MKLTILTLLSLVICHMGHSQDAETQLGDYFSLENTLELFKSSSSLEAFEKALNQKDNSVNNLDLNDDGETDFLMVRDEWVDDVHAIVISAIVSDKETQDVAVIEIEKTGIQEAVLQIIGDEELYEGGSIVEPYEETTTLRGSGPYSPDLYPRITVNVWFWPSVSSLYRPAYITYRSSWRWGYYPRWWTPWRPLTWNSWHPIRVRYAPRYRVTSIHRVQRAHRVYAPQRRVSKTVTVKRTSHVSKTREMATTNKKSKVVTNKNGTKQGKKTVSKKGVKKANGTSKKVKKTKTVKRKVN